MADPTTTNLVLAQPIRGSDVGTWDLPVNGNTGIIDQAFGGVTTLSPTNITINLASSQAQNSVIRLTGTITGNLTIVLPSIYKGWTIDNQILNSPSSFAVALGSTSGASVIGLPPGTQDVFYDGTTVNYRNLGRIGEYWDYAGATVPTWVGLGSTPPYLNCNGSAFSSAAYPILTNLLGTTTLPDQRGRSRYTLNQGTGRITAAGAGIDGNTILTAGGNNGLTLTTTYIPTITATGPGVSVGWGGHGIATYLTPSVNPGTPTSGGVATAFDASGAGNIVFINSATTAGLTTTFTNGSPAVVPSLTPGLVGGITMIRAA